jgi:hypothetical protein
MSLSVSDLSQPPDTNEGLKAFAIGNSLRGRTPTKCANERWLNPLRGDYADIEGALNCVVALKRAKRVSKVLSLSMADLYIEIDDLT